MSARIIHVGKDACHRVGVLQSAGFLVEECYSLIDLRAALESDVPPDAVIFTEDYGNFSQQALEAVRALTEVPLIVLFGEPQRNFADSDFDLVIPHLALPDAWLTEIAALIAHCQAIRMRIRMPVQKAAGTPAAAERKRIAR